MRHHGRDGVRHRAQMDGDVLRLRDHPAACVEQGGGTVAPLLDVGGERGAHEGRTHLFRDRLQQRAEDLELDVHSQSVRVLAFAYDHALMNRGRTR